MKTWNFKFGASSGGIRLEESQVAGRFGGASSGEALATAEMVRQALRAPVSAPEMYRACTPDDRVVIVLDLDIPHASQILEPILESLARDAGIDPANVTIVHTRAARKEQINELIDELPDAYAALTVHEHRPDVESEVSYLASTEQGRRIYLSRVLLDADFFFVVSRIGFDSLTGRRGPSSQFFPVLSDRATLQRAAKTALEIRGSVDGLHRGQDCEEVARLAGLFYGIGVALDGDGKAEQVWIGRYDEVERVGNEYIDQAWTTRQVAGGCDLVIAALSHFGRKGSWEEVGQAIESAERLLGDGGGAIAVLSDVDLSLGPAAELLRAEGVGWETAERLREVDSDDAPALSKCLHAALRNRVYFLSERSAEEVEALGMVPVASLHEVENLAKKFRKVFLLENADLIHVERTQKPIYKRARSQ